jgi:hypothetical protein
VALRTVTDLLEALPCSSTRCATTPAAEHSRHPAPPTLCVVRSIVHSMLSGARDVKHCRSGRGFAGQGRVGGDPDTTLLRASASWCRRTCLSARARVGRVHDLAIHNHLDQNKDSRIGGDV